MPKKLTVSAKPKPALTLNRVSLEANKVCYVIVAQKRLKYTNGRSRIAYIGTTERGMARIAQSAAAHAESVLRLHGVRSFDVHTISCRSRQRVQTWRKLESALLHTFRELYGEVPRCNSQGRKRMEGDEFEYFNRSRIRTIVQQFE